VDRRSFSAERAELVAAERAEVRAADGAEVNGADLILFRIEISDSLISGISGSYFLCWPDASTLQ
jgi:hypothetical protein